MKKILFFAFVMLGVLFQITPASAATDRLHTDGRWIKDESGNIVMLHGPNFGGFNRPYGCGIWQREGYGRWDGTSQFNEDGVRYQMQHMKEDWGFNAMRWTVCAEFWINDIPCGDGSSYRENLKRSIEIAQDYGMYIILAPWKINSTVTDPNLGGNRVLPFYPYEERLINGDHFTEDDFIDFWVDLIQDLRDENGEPYPNYIIDPYNEPNDERTVTHYEDRQMWLDHLARFIPAVRQHTDSIILVQWNEGFWYHRPDQPGIESLDRWVPVFVDYLEANVTDISNLVLSTHIYQGGFIYSPWIGQRPNTYEQLKQEYIDSGLYSTVYDSGYPILIGETGADTRGMDGDWPEGGWDAEKTRYRNSLTILNEWDVGYIGWNWMISEKDVFGLVEGDNDTPWVPPASEGGQILKDMIAEKAGTTTTTTTQSTTTTTISHSQAGISGTLRDKDGNPVQSDITAYEHSTTTKAGDARTGSEGYYDINVDPGTYDIRYDILDQDFYIPSFFLKILSVDVSSRIQDIVQSVTDRPDEKKISFETDVPGDITRVIQTHSPTRPERILMDGVPLEAVMLLVDLEEGTWFHDPLTYTLHIMTSTSAATTTTTTQTTTTTTQSTTTTTSSTTTTTTVPSSGEISISDCDTLDGWSFRGNGELDTVDYVEGTASLREVPDADIWVHGGKYDLEGEWDWSGMNKFRFWAKGEQARYVFVKLFTGWGDWKNWRVQLSEADTWEELSIDLASQSYSNSGTFDISDVHWFEVNYYNPDESWQWDDIRVEGPT